MILMYVACADLGWVTVAKILKDQGSTPPKSICCFVFAISFILFFCVLILNNQDC